MKEGMTVFASVDGPLAPTLRCSQFFSKVSQPVWELDLNGLLGWAISRWVPERGCVLDKVRQK